MSNAERAAPRDNVPREVLPIPDRPRVGLTPFSATDPGATLPPIARLRPPSGAPNVLIVLLDDVGFGASSVFGGPVQTPTARAPGEALVLRYTRFHTCAMCAPTRAALLSGRNHHSVGFGSITETATACTRLQHHPPEHEGDLAGDPATERVFDGDVRQVPRGADLGSQPGRAVRPLADRQRF
jgi:hypothetical protein